MIKITIELDGRVASLSDIMINRNSPITEVVELCVDCIQGFGNAVDPEMLAMYFGEQAGILPVFGDAPEDDMEEDAV